MLVQKKVKSVLNKHKKRDSWFLDDYSVNPYEGCNCNCLYCYIRGSKYGINMEEGLAVKANALEVLEKQLQLRARKNQYGFVAEYDRLYNGQYSPPWSYQNELKRKASRLCAKYQIRNCILA